jgi:hypothetical protein
MPVGNMVAAKYFLAFFLCVFLPSLFLFRYLTPPSHRLSSPIGTTQWERTSCSLNAPVSCVAHGPIWTLRTMCLYYTALPRGPLRMLCCSLASCCVQFAFLFIFVVTSSVCVCLPPLWSSSQSSWLQIQRFGFYSRCYQIF